MTPDEVISAARACVGTPFRHQGRIPGVALDCAGLVVAVAEMLGIPHADQTGYGRLPSNGQLEAALDEQTCLNRALGDPLPGDVLLMTFTKHPQHLGIFTGENLIHSWQIAGKVAEHRMDAAWLRRVVRIYRFVGVAHG